MRAFKIAQAGLLLTVLTLPSCAIHAAVSPFAAMAGAWSGGGVLDTSDGAQERLRCRAAYDVGAGGGEMRLNLRCASDSYNFNLTSEVQYNRLRHDIRTRQRQPYPGLGKRPEFLRRTVTFDAGKQANRFHPPAGYQRQGGIARA
jgi:hypothetical protein